MVGSAAGVVNATADKNGKFSASIDLKTLSPPPNTGEALTFDAVWIGPTRERLKADATTAVQYSKYVVSLTTSVSDEKLTPLQEFSIVSEVEPEEGLPATASITVRTSSLRSHCILV